VPEFDPAAILQVLARHGVDYALIGGYAALLQGSGMATIDVDIVPARPKRNLASLAAALTELDAKIRVAGTEPLPVQRLGRVVAGHERAQFDYPFRGSRSDVCPIRFHRRFRTSAKKSSGTFSSASCITAHRRLTTASRSRQNSQPFDDRLATPLTTG
jgi:hypothetical protein